MLKLELPAGGKTGLRILCLGAHSDDIEIGCGGTLLRLLAERRRLEFDWVVLSATPARAREARRSAGLFLEGASSRRVVVRSFRDGYFPAQFARLKEFFENLKRRPAPDLIFAPWRHDAHQDHRLVSDLVGNTFRNNLVLEYEIPKYDGDLGRPNLFVPVGKSVGRRKVELIRRAFPSQADRTWFAGETFWSILKLRGIESGSETGYAEAFFCRKAVL